MAIIGPWQQRIQVSHVYIVTYVHSASIYSSSPTSTQHQYPLLTYRIELNNSCFIAKTFAGLFDAILQTLMTRKNLMFIVFQLPVVLKQDENG